jgi:hypothetical protein
VVSNCTVGAMNCAARGRIHPERSINFCFDRDDGLDFLPFSPIYEPTSSVGEHHENHSQRHTT